MRYLNVARSLTGLLAAALLVVASPSPAVAGSYTVTGTCGAWDAVNNDGLHIAVFAGCPTLTARNVQGDFRTGPGATGGWVFSAPPGTGISAIRLSGTMIGTGNWQSSIYLEGGATSGTLLENCPGPACPGDSRVMDWASYGGSGAHGVVARVRCAAAGGCSNAEIRWRDSAVDVVHHDHRHASA